MRSGEDIQPEFARYETPAATHRALGLCCTGSGFAMRKRYVCGPRTLGCYGAVFVGKGSGWIETAATFGRLPIDGGALFWLFPTIAHTYAPDPSGWVERWVLFEGPLADTFEQLGFISPARPVVRVGEAPEIPSLFAQAHADFTLGSPFSVVLGAAIVHRLIAVAHQLDNAARNEDDAMTRAIRHACIQLEERTLLRQPPDLEALAHECGMGYSTFRRHFKRVTGYGPKEFVLRVRLSKAKELLAFTSQSVADVAVAVGFDDPYYFSRLFHIKEGLSPTLFREQQGFGRQE